MVRQREWKHGEAWGFSFQRPSASSGNRKSCLSWSRDAWLKWVHTQWDISAQTGKVHFLNYFSSVSPWRWRHQKNLSLPAVGGWKSDGRVISDLSQLTAVFWHSALKDSTVIQSKSRKNNQPSKLMLLWVSKKKKLLMFYSIRATARDRKQRTCSGMKDTLVLVLPNLISVGPDKLEEVIKD